MKTRSRARLQSDNSPKQKRKKDEQEAYEVNKKVKKTKKSVAKQKKVQEASVEEKKKKKQPKSADEKQYKRKQKEETRKSEEKKQKEKKKQQSQIDTKEKQNIKQIIIKGAAPVDQYYFNKDKFHVLVHDNKVYSATLNQTNISNNNNKFYIIQLLQEDANPNHVYLFTRWGRVGSAGQQSNLGPYTINIAKVEYEKKYREKHKKGDYREVEINYNDGEEEDEKLDSNQKKVEGVNDFMESKLNKHVKNFINLIFDIGMMNDQMKKIGYNVNKMPLGKLSKDHIKKGYKILKDLYQQVGKNNANKTVIQNLTNDFYSFIPHDVGYAKMSHFILNTVQKVKDKLEMLESLAQIKVATQIMNRKQDGNRIDNNYKKLNRDITYIERDSFTFKLINDYLQTTHADTHRGYDLELIDLFETSSQTQNQRFTSHLHNKMLLWHGSRLTNYVGILSQGLRIAPPQAPVTGYMFGKGVYFADMSSKSANYCCTSRQNDTGILILGQVALGDMNEKLHSDYYAANLPEGKSSTKGVGRTAPKVENYQTYKDSLVPMGPGFPTNIPNTSLQYNEYIVYKIEQIKIKFILRTKFHYKRY